MITETEALIALVQGNRVKTTHGGVIFAEFSEFGVPSFFFKLRGECVEPLNRALCHAVEVEESTHVEIQGKNFILSPDEITELKKQLEA